MIETKKTFCRFCHVFCGLEVDVEDNKIIAVRGDHDNPVSEGYTCPKGRAEIERINHPERLRISKKRIGDRYIDIDGTQAIDEVSAKLRKIIDENGPEAVAVYVGCGGHRTATGGPWYVAKWLEALGSHQLYTSLTIDSPSLIIAYDRLFGGPLPLSVFDIDHADSAMFVTTNPVVSHLWSMPQSNPSTRLKNALKRGMKLVVIDPRKCDVAKKADVHLQVKPGEDATLLACIIKTIIENNWYDQEYVEHNVSGFDELSAAVAPFELAYTEQRTTCGAADILKAAEIFACASSGAAVSGTGLHMARHQNLSTQLVMTLNALCGRLDRRGGMTHIPGTLGPRLAEQGQRQPLPINLRTEHRSRIRNIQGITGLFGYQEMPTNTLTDEILTEGRGQIKALIVNGGNPALVFSDTHATLRALDTLELLVVNDLFMSATAKHADYVMAVKHPFERVDIPMLSDAYFPFSFQQYSPIMVEAEDDVIEEWDFFWQLAQKLEIDFSLPGLAFDSSPSADQVISALNPHARISLEDIKRNPSGKAYDDGTTEVGGIVPDMIAHADRRIAAGHPEVIMELAEVYAEQVFDDGSFNSEQSFDFRLITYRMREAYCTTGQNLPSLRNKRSYNPALMNQQDMQALSLNDGDQVTIDSGFGQVEAIVEASHDVASHDVASGTVAMAHGWGDPSDQRPVRERGSNVQYLIPRNKGYDKITGLAQQSAIPVNVYR